MLLTSNGQLIYECIVEICRKIHYSQRPQYGFKVGVAREQRWATTMAVALEQHIFNCLLDISAT